MKYEYKALVASAPELTKQINDAAEEGFEPMHFAGFEAGDFAVCGVLMRRAVGERRTGPPVQPV